MTKPETATTSRATKRIGPSRSQPAAHVDRGSETERTFLNGARSDDPLAEEMGEEAVRAMTSGEDETRTQQGDEAAPDLEAQLDGLELQDDDLEDIAAGDPLRSSPPKRL